MLPPIFKVCAAAPAVTALLGAGPTRLYPFGEAPEHVTAPYAVWQVVSGAPENFLADRPDMDSFTLQVDVYAASEAAARAVAGAIRDAIELQAYIVRWGGQSKDPETDSYRISFDVDWHIPRP